MRHSLNTASHSSSSYRPVARHRMHRILAGLAASATLVAGITACSSPAAEDGVGVPGLLKSHELSICGIDYYPPMEFVNDGELTGFDIEMMKAVAAKLNVEFRYVKMKFEGVLPGLDAKRCDIASAAMYLNDDRQKVADAIPYMQTTAQLLVAAGNPKNLKSLDDLSDKSMAIDSGTSNLAISQELNKKLEAAGKAPMKIMEYPNTPDTFQQIRVGRADGVIDADVTLGYVASQEPDVFQYVRFQDVADGTFALYTKKGSPLTAEITGALQALYDDGSLAKFAGNYGLDVLNLDAIFGSK